MYAELKGPAKGGLFPTPFTVVSLSYTSLASHKSFSRRQVTPLDAPTASTISSPIRRVLQEVLHLGGHSFNSLIAKLRTKVSI